jgi:hypothetical protein
MSSRTAGRGNRNVRDLRGTRLERSGGSPDGGLPAWSAFHFRDTLPLSDVIDAGLAGLRAGPRVKLLIDQTS